MNTSRKLALVAATAIAGADLVAALAALASSADASSAVNDAHRDGRRHAAGGAGLAGRPELS